MRSDAKPFGWGTVLPHGPPPTRLATLADLPTKGEVRKYEAL
jgi:hypothetical protein